MEMKILHKDICEQEIMFALVVEEGGEACILSQFIEIIINPGFSQEIITWPDLGGVREIIFGPPILLICLYFEHRLDEPLKNHFIFF